MPIGEKPVEFQIAFTALQARWKYYLVTDLKGTADGFRIINYSRIEVKADADLPRQAALFHLLKYITQPFPKRGV